MNILRLCEIYIGENDQFSKNKFEEFMVTLAPHRWTKMKTNKINEYFIDIGKHGTPCDLPKKLYNGEGELTIPPIVDVHYQVRRVSQAIPRLLDFGQGERKTGDGDFSQKKKNKEKPQKKTRKELLIQFVKDLVIESGGVLTQRTERSLVKMVRTCVDDAARELLDAALEKFSEQIEVLYEKAAMKQSTSGTVLPDTPTLSISEGVAAVVKFEEAGVIVTPMSRFEEQPDLHHPTNEDTLVLEEDFENINTRRDKLISDLKEEVLLQSLLVRRLFANQEKAFELRHRNGKPLLVLLPPDSKSVATFLEDTKWVDQLLCSSEKVEGMLVHLAKQHPETFLKVGKRRQLSTKLVTLDTAQTLALARIGHLNDIARKRVRSFLRCVGNINLQLSIKDQQRIDVDVGLYRTEKAFFGSHLYEWSLMKGKETKAPELVQFWNSVLANEVEAEVDLYLRHLFSGLGDDTEEDKDVVTEMPSLDYLGPGFPQPGVTVLFGGDHGDKNCPISCKLNLSPPSVRKQKKQLGYQCPLITFANVQCSTDTFQLMQKTVMPMVKKQLKELKRSSMLTVFQSDKVSTVFRSYIVPLTIDRNSVKF